MRTVIRHGTLVTPTGRQAADLAFADGSIVAIAPTLPPLPDDREIDATELLVLPGGIDAHTHLDMPYAGIVSTDDFFTGSRAAVMGGTTCLIDFINPAREQGLHAALEEGLAKARGKAVIDYGFHMSLTRFDAAIAREMTELVAEGLTSFKTFLAYQATIGIDDASFFRALQHASTLGALVTVHAENGPVIDALIEQHAAAGQLGPRYHARTRPALAEAEATQRAIALARLAEASLYVVHVTCAGAAQAIARARSEGFPVQGETCPQYLVLDERRYEEPDFGGAKYVMSPPLRGLADQAALWAALAAGELQTVATDHCPSNFAREKRLGLDDFRKIPNGAPGIEDRLALLYTFGVVQGRLSLERMVEVFASEPARIFGLAPRKGALRVGADADLVLFDPTTRRVIRAADHHMRVDYNCYEGVEVHGTIRQVFARGIQVAQDGTFTGHPGSGHYLTRHQQG